MGWPCSVLQPPLAAVGGGGGERRDGSGAPPLARLVGPPSLPPAAGRPDRCPRSPPAAQCALSQNALLLPFF